MAQELVVLGAGNDEGERQKEAEERRDRKASGTAERKMPMVQLPHYPTPPPPQPPHPSLTQAPASCLERRQRLGGREHWQ